MYFFITTVLITLSSLASARYTEPYKTNLWSLSTIERVPGCLDTSPGPWSRGASIFFNHPNEPNFNFSIPTTYDVFYPTTLVNLLQAHGFVYKHTRDVSRSELCGWWDAGEVQVDNRVHGAIFWKYSDLRRKSSVPDFRNFTSWEAVSKNHIPPRLTTRPHDDTLDTIHAILVQSVPNADIYYNWTTALGFTCGVLGALLFFMTLRTCAIAATSEGRGDAESSTDIELDEIRVHNLSRSSMQRLDKDDYVKIPDLTVKPVASDTTVASPTTTNSSATDPPPLYTVDGAGR